MKKFLAILLSAVMLCGITSALAETVTLTYAEVNSETTPSGMIALTFKDKVEELTGGSVIIDLQLSGVLGSEGEVLDGIFGGTGMVDISRISLFSLNNYGCPLTQLLTVPYTFANREHFWAFTETDLAQAVLSEPSDLGLGVRGLFYYEEGFRSFFFTTEVATIDDVAGKKIRVSDAPMWRGIVEGLDGAPTVVNYNELYQALDTGVVDGAEQPIVNYYGMKFHEVAPYMILDNHIIGGGEVIITDEAWAKLDADQQAAVMEAGVFASQFCKDSIQELEDAAKADAVAEGAVFVEVADPGVWQESCAALVDELGLIEGYEAEYESIIGLEY